MTFNNSDETNPTFSLSDLILTVLTCFD